MQYKHLRRRVQHHIPRTQTLLLLFVITGVVLFFFSSVYLGSSYLQEHLKDEQYKNTLGSLPNTRNRITKWSQLNLGMDLEKFGAPPRARLQGTEADVGAFSVDGVKGIGGVQGDVTAGSAGVEGGDHTSLRGRDSEGDGHGSSQKR